MISKDNKQAHLRRKARVRRKYLRDAGAAAPVRLPEARHIYGQIVVDAEGRTLVDGLDPARRAGGRAEGQEQDRPAKAVGKLLAQTALEKGIDKVVFDRNGFLYHGRVKALADAAREGGLKF